jgi:ERCC4-related helicase
MAVSEAVRLSMLPDQVWKTSYRHDDGDLVELFYVPALACAIRYDRMTGYFSADALALAARGVRALIENSGQMRLIVGCTLADPEVEAIEQGYDLREKVHLKLAEVPLTPPDEQARKGLELLAWMIAQNRLDLKVAVPVGPSGKPVKGLGLYHEKVGVVTDSGGNQISFSGSINETAGGWVNNRESFHVHCSWLGGREVQHVHDEVDAFAKLWEDRATSTRVFDFPDAVKQKLLEFLPASDQFVAPPHHAKQPVEPTPGYRLTPDEVRRVVWAYVGHAAELWNGIRVGEATSAVDPWPHQLRAFKLFVEGWPSRRLLIADEVGLGKTITAGLIVRQLWLSGRARHILLMVPKAVMIQWQNELYEKFNLNVPLYDGGELIWKKTHGWQGPVEKAVSREEWHREPLVICSSQLMRRRDRAAELAVAENWDLLLLDEAHHARRRGAGGAQQGGPNALLRLMCDLNTKSSGLLLLTATPMQVDPIEVFDLLQLLGLPPEWAGDSERFHKYFDLVAGNPSEEDMEFLAEMFRSTERAFGPVDESALAKLLPAISKLGRARILKALRDKTGIPLKRLSGAERKAALKVLQGFSPIRYRMTRQTRELLRRYHEQGLLPLPIAKREVRDRPVDLSPQESTLYKAVEDYISTTYNNAAMDKRTAVGFVMTVYRRRLASSFYALRQTLNNRLSRLASRQETATAVTEEDVSQDELAMDVMDEAEAISLASESLVAEERADIEELLKQISKLGTDSKAKRLRDELRQAFADGYDSAIVFSQYADTMNYLKDYLAEELPDVPIASYSGAGGSYRTSPGMWTSCGKEKIKQALKEKSIRLLVCTDAAGEGLNLQFCGVIVNYDLPWNPMKVEQRIGRVDRIGQDNKVVRVINFAYKDTVEADVYFALGQRINLFQGIVGKLQPILSRLPKRFEELALERPEHREASRHRFLADVEGMVRESEEAPFDIDAVAVEPMVSPEFPPPALTLDELDDAMKREAARPAAMEWQPLDLRSYAASLPGMIERVRVTTSAQVFDDHVESHEFFSPGGRLFERVEREEAGSEPSESTTGVCWLIQREEEQKSRFVVNTADGPQEVSSLKALLDTLPHLGPPREFPDDRWPNATVRCVL